MFFINICYTVTKVEEWRNWDGVEQLQNNFESYGSAGAVPAESGLLWNVPKYLWWMMKAECVNW